jgi:hypothetical protein
METVPLTIIFTSTVIAAIVSGFVSWIMKSVDFKFDYKKYILKKRIDAYESANLIFNKFYRIGTFKNGNIYNKVLLPNNKRLPEDELLRNETLMEYYNNLNEELLNILSNRIWFSIIFYNAAVNFINIIGKLLIQFEICNYNYELVSDLATENYEKIITIVDKLDKTYISDISTLGNITSFTKKMIH